VAVDVERDVCTSVRVCDGQPVTVDSDEVQRPLLPMSLIALSNSVRRSVGTCIRVAQWNTIRGAPGGMVWRPVGATVDSVAFQDRDRHLGGEFECVSHQLCLLAVFRPHECLEMASVVVVFGVQRVQVESRGGGERRHVIQNQG